MTSSGAALDDSPRWPVQRPVALAGGALLVAGTLALGSNSWRLAALFMVGGLLGATLYHAAFGFSSACRRAVVERDVSGLTAQLFMLGLAMLLFTPVLAQGQVFGREVTGSVAPVGVQVAVGSFLFGLGMQLGGGCGSGALYGVGGGGVRMAITLIAFCVGAFWGSLDLDFWNTLPRWGSISLAERLGWEFALPLQLGLLVVLWLALRAYAFGHKQQVEWPARLTGRQLLIGPWPLILGAALLALLNWLTLLIAGHPWSITWAFALWGAKAASMLGWDPAASPFWSGGFPARALDGSVFHDVTSIMDIGIIVGALTAAGLAGRFAPLWKVPRRSVIAALIGGLLMGYGARLAFGCNIGAFFSGVASTSLHGWLWIACAMAGTWFGVRLRPLFGLKD